MNKWKLKRKVSENWAQEYFVELFESEGVDITQSFTMDAARLAHIVKLDMEANDIGTSNQNRYELYLKYFRLSFPLLKLTTVEGKRGVIYDVSELDFVQSIKYVG